MRSLGGDVIYIVEFIALELVGKFGSEIDIWEPSMYNWYVNLRDWM